MSQHTLWSYKASTVPSELPRGLRFLSARREGASWRVHIQLDQRSRDSNVVRMLSSFCIEDLNHISWKAFSGNIMHDTFRIGQISERGRPSVSRSPPKKRRAISEDSKDSIGLATLKLIELNDETAYESNRCIRTYAEQGNESMRWHRLGNSLKKVSTGELRPWCDSYVVERRSSFARPDYLPKSAEVYLPDPEVCEALVNRLRTMSCTEFATWGFEGFPHPSVCVR